MYRWQSLSSKTIFIPNSGPFCLLELFNLKIIVFVQKNKLNFVLSLKNHNWNWNLRLCIKCVLLDFKTYSILIVKPIYKMPKETREMFLFLWAATKLNFAQPAKGQLILKCPLGVIVWTKIPTKKFDKFCPKIWKGVKS